MSELGRRRKGLAGRADGSRGAKRVWYSAWHAIPRTTMQWLSARIEEAASTDPALFDRLYDALQETACLEFPLGELLNGALAGYVWAWGMRGLFSQPYATEESKHTFACQGLEGLIRVEGIPLSTALTAALFMDAYRVGISVRTNPASIAERVRAVLLSGRA